MTPLEQYLLGAIGAGIVAVAGFAARIMWVILPRQLANNERQTAALVQASQTIAWLPHVLYTNELRFEAALSRGLTQLQVAAGVESEKTRALFEVMFDKMQEAIERRLSGQEQALHETTVEMARTTGNMAAVSVTASGKVTAVSSTVATQTLTADDIDSGRATPTPPEVAAAAAKARPPGRGLFPTIPGH